MDCELRMLSVMPVLAARAPMQAPCRGLILPPPTSHVYFPSDADPLRDIMWQARHGESAAKKNCATAWPKLRIALCALCARTSCHLRPSGKQRQKLSSSAHEMAVAPRLQGSKETALVRLEGTSHSESVPFAIRRACPQARLSLSRPALY